MSPDGSNSPKKNQCKLSSSKVTYAHHIVRSLDTCSRRLYPVFAVCTNHLCASGAGVFLLSQLVSVSIRVRERENGHLVSGYAFGQMQSKTMPILICASLVVRHRLPYIKFTKTIHIIRYCVSPNAIQRAASAYGKCSSMVNKTNSPKAILSHFHSMLYHYNIS